MTEQLKPCPFCGKAAYIGGDEGGADGFFAGCQECFCNVGKAYGRSAMPSHMFASPDEAIAAWNRRAEVPA